MTSVIHRPTMLRGSLPEHLGAPRESAPVGELRLRVAPTAFEPAVRMLREAGARFVTIFLADTPDPALVGVFALHGELVVLRAPGGAADGSIGDWWPAARWAEQELIERRAAPRGQASSAPGNPSVG